MKAHKKYSTVIIEPSPVVREGLKLLLEKNPCFQVTACFPDLPSLDDKYLKEEVHIILFNAALIKFYKPAPVRTLFAGYPEACIIAIHYQYVAGETLRSFDGILDIYDEGEIIPQKVIKIIETAPHNEPSAENVELSDREKDILIALAQGLTNKEIADRLHISPHTVISHRKNIIRKTGIKTVSGLTLYALFNNLVSQDELL